MENLKIIKIGGKLIDDESEFSKALKVFAGLPAPKILVHGGGASATAISKQMGIKPNLQDGRRTTDADALKVVQMVYAGLINKNIVAGLQVLKCPALGLSGADGNSILAVKRPIRKIDYGYVGDVTEVNATAISKLITAGFVPVFCALTHDGKGQMLNTNADTIAAEIAVGLSDLYRTQLFFCFEKDGVLKDIDEPDSVIPHITKDSYKILKQNKIIAQGMLPKIDNAFQSLDKGVSEVCIGHFNALTNSNSVSTRLTVK